MKPVQLAKVVGSIFGIAASCRVYGQEGRGSEGVGTTGSADGNRQWRKNANQAIAKAGIPTSRISIATRQAKVTLTGSVSGADQIAKAVEVAKGVAGVISLDDRLTLAFSDSRTELSNNKALFTGDCFGSRSAKFMKVHSSGTRQAAKGPGRVKTRNDALRRFRMFDRGQWRQYQPVSRSGFLVVQDARCRP